MTEYFLFSKKDAILFEILSYNFWDEKTQYSLVCKNWKKYWDLVVPIREFLKKFEKKTVQTSDTVATLEIMDEMLPVIPLKKPINNKKQKQGKQPKKQQISETFCKIKYDRFFEKPESLTYEKFEDLFPRALFDLPLEYFTKDALKADSSGQITLKFMFPSFLTVTFSKALLLSSFRSTVDEKIPFKNLVPYVANEDDETFFGEDDAKSTNSSEVIEKRVIKFSQNMKKNTIAADFLGKKYIRDYVPNPDAPTLQAFTLKSMKKYYFPVEEPVKSVYFLTHGGNFAGSIFVKPANLSGWTSPIHKNFHKYVNRVKSHGQRQNAHDKSKFAKSIGAQIRRQNEEHFSEKMQDTMKDWQPHLKDAQHIFFFAPGIINQAYMFDEEFEGSLDLSDLRVQKLPMKPSETDATFSNLISIFENMLSIQFGKLTNN